MLYFKVNRVVRTGEDTQMDIPFVVSAPTRFEVSAIADTHKATRESRLGLAPTPRPARGHLTQTLASVWPA
jgi:hypothetical protein